MAVWQKGSPMYLLVLLAVNCVVCGARVNSPNVIHSP